MSYQNLVEKLHQLVDEVVFFGCNPLGLALSPPSVQEEYKKAIADMDEEKVKNICLEIFAIYHLLLKNNHYYFYFRVENDIRRLACRFFPNAYSLASEFDRDYPELLSIQKRLIQEYEL